MFKKKIKKKESLLTKVKNFLTEKKSITYIASLFELLSILTINSLLFSIVSNLFDNANADELTFLEFFQGSIGLKILFLFWLYIISPFFLKNIERRNIRLFACVAVDSAIPIIIIIFKVTESWWYRNN